MRQRPLAEPVRTTPTGRIFCVQARDALAKVHRPDAAQPARGVRRSEYRVATQKLSSVASLTPHRVQWPVEPRTCVKFWHSGFAQAEMRSDAGSLVSRSITCFAISLMASCSDSASMSSNQSARNARYLVTGV